MALVISKKYSHIINEDNAEEYIKNNCVVASVVDLSKVKDYSKDMCLKDKRNSIYRILFVGNMRIDIINIKTNTKKSVSITDILHKYEILKG